MNLRRLALPPDCKDVIDLIEENSILEDLVQDDLNLKKGIVQKNLALMANNSDRLVVQFRDLNAERDVFCLELGKYDLCNVVLRRVAEKVGVESLRIRLTRHLCYSNIPGSHHEEFKYHDHCLLDILDSSYDGICNVLYYEVLAVRATDLQNWFTRNVSYGYPDEKEIKVLLPKHSKVEDLLKELKKEVKVTNCNGELRLVGIYNFKIHKIFPLDEKIEDIPEYFKMQADKVPEEKNLGCGHHVIRVYHFFKINGGEIAEFGKPFFFVIRDDETVAEVKVRIQKKLSFCSPRLSKWRITVMCVGGPKYLIDDDVLSYCFEGEDDVFPHYLGLEHSTEPCDDHATIEIIETRNWGFKPVYEDEED